MFCTFFDLPATQFALNLLNRNVPFLVNGQNKMSAPEVIFTRGHAPLLLHSCSEAAANA
jgi:hypothetical protein